MRVIAGWPGVSLVRVQSQVVEVVFKEMQDAKAKVQSVKDEIACQHLNSSFIVVPPYSPMAFHLKSPVQDTIPQRPGLLRVQP